MTNHVHLLIERQAEKIGRVMQRLLTGYSQYYNRRYRHVGHVFQGRHKAILCESDDYLIRLVRYIHLNPVRAGMVDTAGQYLYSSHIAYIGIESPGIVDIDSVLRFFDRDKGEARRLFTEYVDAVGAADDAADLCPAEDVLGSEKFVDSAIHQIGDTGERPRRRREKPKFDAEAMLAAVEAVFGMPRTEFCSDGKAVRPVMAKEVLILCGREAGAALMELSAITALDPSNVGRRFDAARQSVEANPKLAYAKELVEKEYRARIAITQV